MDVGMTAIERARTQGYHPIESGSTIDFPPVEVDHIYDRNGSRIGGYQRIMRGDSGDTLAVHTASYEMRPYADSFDLLEKAIAESSLDRRNLMVKTEFSHNGGRCFRSYLFPHIAIGDDDPVSLQVLGFDSYDGTYSTALAAGGYRHICLNGCFFGKTIQQLKVRHTSGASQRFVNGLEKVMQAAAAFTEMAPRLAAWKHIHLKPHEFRELMQGMPQITEQLGDHLLASFVAADESNSLYDAWNVCTAWATRGPGSAQSRVDRDRRVAGLIESPHWLKWEEGA